MPSSSLSPPSAARAQPHAGRLAIVDIARGLAIVQMVAYHLCYDLDYFSWIHVAMLRDDAWIAWRTAIVAQFLVLTGVALALRTRGPGPADPDWRRWGQIAGCAALVSLASWRLFGARFIWFGVLHFVAAAQLLLLPLARLGAANIVLGAIAVGVGIAVRIPAFAADGLSWIGFSPVKPQTEDFVPLFPWLGVVLVGMGAANLWQRSRGALSRRLSHYDARAWRPLVLLGRWPLTVYMLHQPLLFCALTLVAFLTQAAR